ncbi:hypothetical protein D9M70_568780 [compost metagenome]
MRSNSLTIFFCECITEDRKRTKDDEWVLELLRPGIQLSFDFFRHSIQSHVGVRIHSIETRTTGSTRQRMSVVSAGKHHLIVLQHTEHFAASTHSADRQTTANHFPKHGHIRLDLINTLQATVCRA